MNDETSNNGKRAARREARRRRVPEPVERSWFALQERVIWPLQDRFTLLGPGPSLKLLAGGGALAVLVVAAVAIALSAGGGSSNPARTAVETGDTREPLAATSTPSAQPEPEPKSEPPRETLHGATPVFPPPSPASKGGERTGKSKAVDSGAAGDEAPGSGGAADASDSAGASRSSSGDSAGASSADSSSPSPAAATISSGRKGSGADKGAGGATAGTAAARSPVPAGPPAGPAALKVAREFAQGFVVYETGGEKVDYRDALAASATPELTKALLQRPPKQPAGVKVPRAKVLNVVAGPSRGPVYKVSVSLLRVGVTSELRLDMERTKPAGEGGKRVEWRVTNVLG